MEYYRKCYTEYAKHEDLNHIFISFSAVQINELAYIHIHLSKRVVRSHYTNNLHVTLARVYALLQTLYRHPFCRKLSLRSNETLVVTLMTLWYYFVKAN